MIRIRMGDNSRAQPHQLFAYCVMYASFDGRAWEPDCYVQGWASEETLEDQLAGAYEEIKRESGRPYILITLPPGEFFYEGPALMELVH